MSNGREHTVGHIEQGGGVRRIRDERGHESDDEEGEGIGGDRGGELDDEGGSDGGEVTQKLRGTVTSGQGGMLDRGREEGGDV